MLLQWNNTGGAGGASVPWSSTPNALTPPNFSLTRASTGTYFDSAGLLQTAAINAARGTYRYNGSAWVFDGTLVEGAATNSCLQARQLGTAPWSVSGTAGAQNVTGRDGVANKGWTLTDASAASFDGSYTQSVTVPVDSLPTAIAVWLKKTSGGTSPTFGINLNITGGTTVAASPRINADTGAILSGAGNAVVTDEGNWWRIDTYITNNGTALNTSFNVTIFPATAANGSGADTATATGSNVIDGVQIQIGVNRVGSFIDTTTVAVTRSADVLTASTSGLLANAQGFAAMRFRTIASNSGVLLGTQGGAYPMYTNSANFILWDGTTNPISTATTWPVGTVRSTAVSWNGTSYGMGLDGAVNTATAGAGMSLAATLRVGDFFAAGSASPYSMVLQSLRLGTRSATDSELAGWTT